MAVHNLNREGNQSFLGFQKNWYNRTAGLQDLKRDKRELLQLIMLIQFSEFTAIRH